MPAKVELLAAAPEGTESILSSEALAFVADLHTQFAGRRAELLAKRAERAAEIESGAKLGFLAETEAIRAGEWQVGPAPADLNDRRVEITGPVNRRMMINALNSGAKVFMADLEDATSPSWFNSIDGQLNIYDSVRRTISFTNPDGRVYELKDDLATLVILSLIHI